MNVCFQFQKVKKEVGDVTIVVNNAGTVYPADLRSTKDEEITKTFEVNILGHFWVSVSQKPFRFVHLLLRYMKLITEFTYFWTGNWPDLCLNQESSNLFE